MLLIFVHSDPRHTIERAAIRSTWANMTYYTREPYDVNISVIFAVGFPQDTSGADDLPDMDALRAVKAESLENGDVLFLNMPDAYDNLAYKSLLTMLWIREHCAHVPYVYKTDDDVVLNTFGWLNVIKHLQEMSMSCYIVCCAWIRPIVFREGQYEVTRAEYDAENYPSFCSGSGYLMSRDAMAAILEISSHVGLLRKDDPYFTGILTQPTEVSIITVQQDAYLITEKELMVLRYHGVMLLHHPNPIQWVLGWETFVARSRDPTLRRALTFHTVDNNEGIYVPAQYTIPHNITLNHQCSRTQEVIFYLDV